MKQSSNRTIERKKEIVHQLEQDLSKAKSVTFVDFSGLEAHELDGLRGDLLEADGCFQVAKNTLIRRAVRKLGIASSQLNNVFEGPTALVFSFQDALAGIKIANEFKDRFAQLKFKGGIFENDFVDSESISELAEIPSREDLLAQFVTTAKAPLQRLVTNANAPLQRFNAGLKILSERE